MDNQFPNFHDAMIEQLEKHDVVQNDIDLKDVILYQINLALISFAYTN